MKIAGRCACGMAADIAAQDPEDHLACNGLRRCRQCLEVKPMATGFRKHRRVCKRCKAAYHLEYIRHRMATDPAFRERHREACRLWNKLAYANRKDYAERQRARNRERYHTDPAYAERMKANYRRRYRERKDKAA